MQFVLDCSVAISWCLVDENDDYANALLAMMPDCEAFVPGIWSLLATKSSQVFRIDTINLRSILY